MREPYICGEERSKFYHGKKGVTPKLQFPAQQSDQRLIENQGKCSQAHPKPEKDGISKIGTKHLEIRKEIGGEKSVEYAHSSSHYADQYQRRANKWNCILPLTWQLAYQESTQS